jgi:hypothetical protein
MYPFVGIQNPISCLNFNVMRINVASAVDCGIRDVNRAVVMALHMKPVRQTAPTYEIVRLG